MPAEHPNPPTTGENGLLAALPPDERARLAPMLTLVEVETGRNYQRSGEPTAFVYFPTTGLFSLLSVPQDGRTVEVGALGCEGFVGLPVVFEDDAPAFDTIGQVAGKAWRMRADDLRAELARGGAAAPAAAPLRPGPPDPERADRGVQPPARDRPTHRALAAAQRRLGRPRPLRPHAGVPRLHARRPPPRRHHRGRAADAHRLDHVPPRH